MCMLSWTWLGAGVVEEVRMAMWQDWRELELESESIRNKKKRKKEEGKRVKGN
jgi:hypothetical protein